MKDIAFTKAIERATLQLTKGVFVTAGRMATENIPYNGAYAGFAGPNTMTVGWGGLNYYWAKPFFVAPVRASRFTYGLLLEQETFTVSVPFADAMKEALGVCGAKSGRDTDKYALAGLTLAPGKAVATPVIEGCEIYFECITRMKQTMEPGAVPTDVKEKFYGNDDWHTLFYGEIAACYEG